MATEKREYQKSIEMDAAAEEEVRLVQIETQKKQEALQSEQELVTIEKGIADSLERQQVQFNKIQSA